MPRGTSKPGRLALAWCWDGQREPSVCPRQALAPWGSEDKPHLTTVPQGGGIREGRDSGTATFSVPVWHVVALFALWLQCWARAGQRQRRRAGPSLAQGQGRAQQRPVRQDPGPAPTRYRGEGAGAAGAARLVTREAAEAAGVPAEEPIAITDPQDAGPAWGLLLTSPLPSPHVVTEPWEGVSPGSR